MEDQQAVAEQSLSNIQPKPPSRWWVVYHFWAGICLFLYIDLSGLSRFLVRHRGDVNVEHAQDYASQSAGLSILALGIGYFFSYALIKAISESRMAQDTQRIVKVLLPFGYFASMVVFSALTASNLDLPRATYTQPSSAAQLSRTEPVRAFTTTQDAEGLTQEDLDQAALENFEWWIIEEMLAKGKERFGQKGNNPSDFRPNVAVDSSYFSIDGIKLAIINANFSDMVRFIFIFGFKGEQFHKVSCFRPSNHDIPMWTGPCGDEILETFGVTIRQ